MSMDHANPVLVEITRGDAVESRHRGAVAIADASGRLVSVWGDVESPVYMRSALKPLQALVFLECGAAERFSVNDAEVALACASHGAEAGHVEAIGAWLGRLGLGPDDLECGAHMPIDAAAADALVGAGETPGRMQNNCSGKHTGFLTAALHLDAPTKGYIKPAHPVQERVAAVLAEMAGCDLGAAPRGTDGCGVPVLAMGLAAAARAMAGLACPDDLPAPRAAAARRVVAAMTAHPRLVAGNGRFDTMAIDAGRGAFAVKGGAEGVHAAILPGLGLGVALKIDDGAKRAAETAMAALLDRLGVLDAAARRVLGPWLDGTVTNTTGAVVGRLRWVAPAAD